MVRICGFCENYSVHLPKSSNPFAITAFFFLGVGCSIVGMEALLHTIEQTPLWQVLPVVERELGLPDSDIGYRFQDNYELINIRENRARVSTNAFGMRDKERWLIKPINTFRTAVMGDSFTEALQVTFHETFTAQTEVELNRAPPLQENKTVDYEVLNFGMSGFGPLQQLLHYQKNALAFDPDLVVFVVGINDFLSPELSNDASGPAYVEDNNGNLKVGYAFRNITSHQITGSSTGKLFFWAMDNSRLARAAFLKLKVGNSIDDAYYSAGSGCKRFEKQLVEQTRLWSDLHPKSSSQRLEKLLTDVRATNENTSSPRPISFAIYGLLVPPEQCKPELAMRENLVRIINQKMSQYNITLLDFESGLAEFGEEQYLNREYQGFGTSLGRGHLNRQGHKAFADLLTKHIIARLK